MRTRMVGVLGAAVLVISGCGSSGGYDNTARPPAPVNVGIVITNARVHVSPAHLGAGPVVLLVSNQSGSSRDLTLASAGGGGSCVTANASSGPIAPQDTARVSVELIPGSCTVGVRDGSAASTQLVVGAKRTSAQADLLQP